MPETTPNLGLQAPLGTEPVSQGDDLMRANNTILDSEVQALIDATTNLHFTRSATGLIFSGAISGPTTFTIDYSAAGFTAPPQVLFSWYEAQIGFTSLHNNPAPTLTGATVVVAPASGSTIPRVRWIAFGN